MKKTLINLLLLSNLLGIAQVTNVINILKDRPADFEYYSAPDSLGNRIISKTALMQSVAKTQTNNIQLPYPIIFIHGLNSEAETWVPTTFNFLTPQYGLVNGGRFDYCLNFDVNNALANTNFYPTAGADIAIYAGTWSAGDFYYVNFDVGSDGAYMPNHFASNYILSDQSAITKQGRALGDAIARVLQLTGRDKVILMGHSMGGLAAREYLQNTSNWQPDGQSHVAKLATTGTPHGGSNATSFGIVSNSTEGQSEAIRDLRREYYYSLNQGVYLFGGPENLPYMEDQLCCYFYNSDVNCNGTIQTNIVGLNQKNIYSNLDYSCIVGVCSGCVGTTNNGDGIVPDFSANLNTYYANLTKNIFY
jgi:pimeloyl-ACP methyl ester carboxylesterase